MEGWASIKNAAKYADVSVSTMRGFLKQGLKHSRLPSGLIRIRYADIDEFLTRYQVQNQMQKRDLDALVDDIFRDFRRK